MPPKKKARGSSGYPTKSTASTSLGNNYPGAVKFPPKKNPAKRKKQPQETEDPSSADSSSSEDEGDDFESDQETVPEDSWTIRDFGDIEQKFRIDLNKWGRVDVPTSKAVALELAIIRINNFADNSRPTISQIQRSIDEVEDWPNVAKFSVIHFNIEGGTTNNGDQSFFPLHRQSRVLRSDLWDPDNNSVLEEDDVWEGDATERIEPGLEPYHDIPQDFYAAHYGPVLGYLWGDLTLSKDPKIRKIEVVELALFTLPKHHWTVRRVYFAFQSLQSGGPRGGNFARKDFLDHIKWVAKHQDPTHSLLPSSTGFSTPYLQDRFAFFWNQKPHQLYVAAKLQDLTMGNRTATQAAGPLVENANFPSDRRGQHWEDGPAMARGDQIVPSRHPCIKTENVSTHNLPPYHINMSDNDLGHFLNAFFDGKVKISKSDFGTLWQGDFNTKGELKPNVHPRGEAFDGVKGTNWDQKYAGVRLDGGKALPKSTLQHMLRRIFTSSGRPMISDYNEDQLRRKKAWEQAAVAAASPGPDTSSAPPATETTPASATPSKQNSLSRLRKTLQSSPTSPVSADTHKKILYLEQENASLLVRANEAEKAFTEQTSALGDLVNEATERARIAEVGAGTLQHLKFVFGGIIGTANRMIAELNVPELPNLEVETDGTKAARQAIANDLHSSTLDKIGATELPDTIADNETLRVEAMRSPYSQTGHLPPEIMAKLETRRRLLEEKVAEDAEQARLDEEMRVPDESVASEDEWFQDETTKKKYFIFARLVKPDHPGYDKNDAGDDMMYTMKGLKPKNEISSSEQNDLTGCGLLQKELRREQDALESKLLEERAPPKKIEREKRLRRYDFMRRPSHQYWSAVNKANRETENFLPGLKVVYTSPEGIKTVLRAEEPASQAALAKENNAPAPNAKEKKRKQSKKRRVDQVDEAESAVSKKSAQQPPSRQGEVKAGIDKFCTQKGLDAEDAADRLKALRTLAEEAEGVFVLVDLKEAYCLDNDMDFKNDVHFHRADAATRDRPQLTAERLAKKTKLWDAVRAFCLQGTLDVDIYEDRVNALTMMANGNGGFVADDLDPTQAYCLMENLDENIEEDRNDAERLIEMQTADVEE